MIEGGLESQPLPHSAAAGMLIASSRPLLAGRPVNTKCTQKKRKAQQLKFGAGAYLCLPCRPDTASKSLVAGLRMMWASSSTILQQHGAIVMLVL